MKARSLRNQPLYTQIVDEILAMIRNGELQPGQKIPSESDMAKAFGVGRNSVREAIKALTIGGAVYSRAGRGTFVSLNALDLANSQGLIGLFKESISLTEMIEVRMILEVAAVGLAAERATPEEIVEFQRQLSHLMSNISANKSWSEDGLAFHLVIAKMGKNKLLVHLLEHITDELDSVREVLAATDCDINAMLEDHIEICECISNRDAKAAQAAMETHLQRVLSAVVESGATSTVVHV